MFFQKANTITHKALRTSSHLVAQQVRNPTVTESCLGTKAQKEAFPVLRRTTLYSLKL